MSSGFDAMHSDRPFLYLVNAEIPRERKTICSNILSIISLRHGLSVMAPVLLIRLLKSKGELPGVRTLMNINQANRHKCLIRLPSSSTRPGGRTENDEVFQLWQSFTDATCEINEPAVQARAIGRCCAHIVRERAADFVTPKCEGETLQLSDFLKSLDKSGQTSLL